jgi:hypothetical protein
MSSSPVASDFKFELSEYNDGLKKVEGHKAIVERCKRAILSSGLLGDSTFGVNIFRESHEISDEETYEKIANKCQLVLDRSCPGQVEQVYVQPKENDKNTLIIGVRILGNIEVFSIEN